MKNIPVTIESFPGNLPVDCLALKSGSFEIGGVAVKYGGQCRVDDCLVVAKIGSDGVDLTDDCAWFDSDAADNLSS